VKPKLSTAAIFAPFDIKYLIGMNKVRIYIAGSRCNALHKRQIADKTSALQWRHPCGGEGVSE
jgi:hypothetical protein